MQTKRRSAGAGASARARKAADAGRRATGAASGGARRAARGRGRQRETAPKRVIGRLRGLLPGLGLGFAAGRSRSCRPARERTLEPSDEVLKSLESGQPAALEAIRRFADTVDEMLPALGERPSKREEFVYVAARPDAAH
jgi:hypothetical protein